MHLTTRIIAPVIALGLAAVVGHTEAEAATDMEKMQKATRQYISPSVEKPKKGLCYCPGDSYPLGIKRVGLIRPSTVGAGGGLSNVAVRCELPAYDGAGTFVPNMGPPTTCSDWRPLAK